MDFLHDLTGSLFGALALGIIIYVGGSMAIGYLARKSNLLKPIGVGLKLVVLFMSTRYSCTSEPPNIIQRSQTT